MTPQQQQAILTIGLLAAFADGANDEREREHLRQIAESLGGESGLSSLPGLYQQVLLKRVDLASASAALSDAAHRQLAYEMAVCVCDADGTLSEPERRFLDTLSATLGLTRQDTATVEREAGQIAELTDIAAPAAAAKTAPTLAVPVPPAAPAAPAAPASGPSPVTDDKAADRSILNYAILCGALELLPQSWASMAIIPLQIKMVYGIGKTQGYELDQGHIRELLATVGVGMTSQYLEQFGRKLLGGLLGSIGGGLGKAVGRSATSMAFSFATTYALGQLARRYYAGGRQMSTALLKDTFNGLLGPAKELQGRYLPEIQQKAATLDMNQVIGMVRS